MADVSWWYRLSSSVESGGTDDKYLSQSGAELSSSSGALSDNSLPVTAPSQVRSSIAAGDLAAIGASNTGATSSTSLATDAQQLPGQLSTWDQQQAAAAAAAAAAEAARQQAIQQQQQFAQWQAQAAQEGARVSQAQQTEATETAAQTEVPSSNNGAGWASTLMQGLGIVQGFSQRAPRPAPASQGQSICSIAKAASAAGLNGAATAKAACAN
jgi:hypothetical protein